MYNTYNDDSLDSLNIQKSVYGQTAVGLSYIWRWGSER